MKEKRNKRDGVEREREESNQWGKRGLSYESGSGTPEDEVNAREKWRVREARRCCTSTKVYVIGNQRDRFSRLFSVLLFLHGEFCIENSPDIALFRGGSFPMHGRRAKVIETSPFVSATEQEREALVFAFNFENTRGIYINHVSAQNPSDDETRQNPLRETMEVFDCHCIVYISNYSRIKKTLYNIKKYFIIFL